MTTTLSNLRTKIDEGNDYKRSRQYNKLSPKVKRAVDMVYKSIETDKNAVANFEKNVSTAAKKHNVSNRELMNYFDKETLTILRR
ncbi:MAG: hypothetical protein CMK29_06115 [Porticoccaceae bacterium]|nr:hypothetical protein [Porticoccaceae bacterium]|tara:strand:- start:4607 stop:4861 length:255 start_codon:yes stop_codon:yes gene_type:complete